MDTEGRFRLPSLSRAKRIGGGVVGVVALLLTWTGWTGPELLHEIANVSWFGFFDKDWFRSVLVIMGLVMILIMLALWFRAEPATTSAATIPILPPHHQASGSAVARLFTIHVPDEIKPGHLYNHKIRYLPDVWIGKPPSAEPRNLFFDLAIPGYEFEDAHFFHRVYSKHPEIAQLYFSNPLDVNWLNRTLHIAFIIRSGNGKDSPFRLIVKDENAEQTFTLEPGVKWACFSDGSCRKTD